jgi:hypothetical protein
MRMPLEFLQSDTRVDRPPSLRHRSPPLPWPRRERGCRSRQTDLPPPMYPHPELGCGC